MLSAMRTDVVDDLLTDLLDAAVASLTDPPDRQGKEHGAFAHDCEMLVVHVEGVTFDSLGQPSGAYVRVATIPSVQLVVTLLRCWPTPEHGKTEPSMAAITAAAAGLAQDGAALTHGISSRWADGTLFPTAAVDADDVTLAPGLAPVGPEGALAGWTFSLSVNV